MNMSLDKEFRTTVAARLAGEDIRKGDIVAILYQTIEWVSFLWGCSEISMSPEDLVRTRYLPFEPGKPYKVVTVCLPFVYVKDVKQRITGFDTRRQELVRLDRKVGKGLWKQLRKKIKEKQDKKN